MTLSIASCRKRSSFRKMTITETRGWGFTEVLEKSLAVKSVRSTMIHGISGVISCWFPYNRITSKFHPAYCAADRFGESNDWFITQQTFRFFVRQLVAATK